MNRGRLADLTYLRLLGHGTWHIDKHLFNGARHHGRGDETDGLDDPLGVREASVSARDSRTRDH